MSPSIQNPELRLPLTGSSTSLSAMATPKKEEPVGARKFHLLLCMVVCLLLSLNVMIAGLCVYGYSSLNGLRNEMENVKQTTRSALAQMDLMHDAIKNTTSSLLKADRHAHNIVDNTYTMCNMLTVGTEKEKACHNDHGYRD